MSSAFYPLGMNSYNNRLPQGGYKSWKGTGTFSNPVGVTAGNIRPLTNNDPTNSAPQKFGLPRPIQHYRKGSIVNVTSPDNLTNNRQVKSSTGGSLIGQMIDIPGGFSIKRDTEELKSDCQTCPGIGIISDWQPITDLTEKPQAETQTLNYCCNQERNALKRIRSSNTKLKKNYFTSTTNYLYNRCQTFEQKQFSYLSSGTSTVKPGDPLSKDNKYKGNCNPNLEIQHTLSLLSNSSTLTPSNPLGCQPVQYKPNNFKYAQQGAVSSSNRLLRLNVETIDTNRANIVKTRENLTKSKYFPNAVGNKNENCCIDESRLVYSFGTTILYITYMDASPPIAGSTFSFEADSPSLDALASRATDCIALANAAASHAAAAHADCLVATAAYNDATAAYNDATAAYNDATPSFNSNNDEESNLVTSLSNAKTAAESAYATASNAAIAAEATAAAAMDAHAIAVAAIATDAATSVAANVDTNIPPESSSIENNYIPVIQNDFISVSATYEIIGLTPKKVKMILKYKIFTQSDAELLTIGLSFANTIDYYNQNASIIEIIQFDGMPLFGGGYQFARLTPEILISAPDQPRITYGTSALNCFKDCTNFNSPGIINWNIKNVVNLQGMFANASLFNQDISSWNVSNVTDMTKMFMLAKNFNNGETGKDPTDVISNVSLPSYTTSTSTLNLNGATLTSTLSVNDVIIITTGPVELPTIIYTSKITTLNTTSLILTPNYGSNIGTSTITSIKKQVIGTKPLTNWNTSNVTDMQYMFSDATYFNQNINTWNIPNAIHLFSSSSTLLRGIFNNGILAGSNNNSLKNLNTSRSGSIGAMFLNSIGFNQNISNWDVSKVTTMNGTFSGATLFNNGDTSGTSTKPLTDWRASKCIDFTRMFNSATSFNQNISNLVNTTNVSACDLTQMFTSASVFNNGDTSGTSTKPLNWITTNVTNMSAMFVNASVFNQPIDTSNNYWNTGKVTNMFQMFASAVTLRFNQPLGKWDVSNVTNMGQMFYGAIYFNQDIALWKTGKVTDMFDMFRNATVFNHSINTDIAGSWDVSNVTRMSQMFYLATNFNNGYPSGTSLNWSAHKCLDFGSMFRQASAFNQPISYLVDTSGIDPSGCNMSAMFQLATQFNQNINNWNVSRVTSMNLMFSGATNFNNGNPSGTFTNSLTDWRAPKCTTYASMFSTAVAFNQAITNLVDTSNVAGCTMASMFTGATIFNNGERGTQDLSANSATYTNGTATLYSPSAKFTTDLSQNSVLIITSGTTIIYTSQIQRIISDASLVLLTPYGTTLSVSRIQKQLPGTLDLTWNTTNVTTMANMFQNAYYFNQNISNWSTLKVTSMTSMFTGLSTSLKTTFNNGKLAGSNNVSLNWSAPICTTVASMFLNNSGFNQGIPTLVNTSNIANCSLNSMFQTSSVFNQNINTWNTSNVTSMASMFNGARTFNNGQLNPQDVSGTVINAYYLLSGSILNCPGARFMRDLSINDVLIITTPTLVYSSDISTNIISDVSLNLRKNYGFNIGTSTVPLITSIKKQVAGGSEFDLSWNTQNVTTTANMFQNATYFNQKLPWNMRKNRNVTSMFSGTTTTFINLFNNGQLISGTTQPLNPSGGTTWDFSSNLTNVIGSTTSAWHTSSRLTQQNAVTVNPALTY
jgi:surface protein